ncbi:hypothetical protein P280DRAFT_504074 [Massarina eburnea CBS 473.64]|uniref:Tyrosine specific protein phosphatases domain-containing protein n=1 Tax=Massarina eburnea CBS 473.64 TaxID=1395130 RepID=A0A6A6SB65_9PLEO|nr:hypothetical protein P280DRAFT_504074 [Massarina eburnea CBS 473.64]
MDLQQLQSFVQKNGTLRLPQALVNLLKAYLAAATDQPRTDLFEQQHTRPRISFLLALLNPLDSQSFPDHPVAVGMVKTAVLWGIGLALCNLGRRKAKIAADKGGFMHAADTIGYDAAATDPGLLKKYSAMREYTVPATGFTYTGIRTYYQPHTHESKLPQESKLVPLLVFIHGLGGSIAQFHPLLTSLTNIATCLAIDLPGCGVSVLDPTGWEAYTTGSLVHLLATVINAHRDVDRNQDVVLVGHSLGCSLAVLLASSTSPYAHLLSQNIAGLIAFCPQAQPLDDKHQRSISIVTSIPTPLFDMMRKWDRREGVHSASVARMAGADADDETKKLQLRFNAQSRSSTWKRMARGMLGALPEDAVKPTSGGLPTKSVWAGLRIPVFLAAGAADTITPASNVELIARFLETKHEDIVDSGPSNKKNSMPIAAAPINPAILSPDMKERKDSAQKNASRTPSTLSNQAPSIKKIIFPPPAAHSFIFTPGPTLPTLLGHINTFLAENVDGRLSSSWQMQYFTTEGKWDVKNLEKWQAVEPVSAPIASTFRAMKTLRGVDPSHCPAIFVKSWAGRLTAVLDISHDTPVYDPQELMDGDIPYYKFPTVSKQPPKVEEVKGFCRLVDEIRGGIGAEGKGVVGVHCHYGFNRTGFFLVSYMVERLGFEVSEAIEEFRQARAPGIRHAHFIHELHRRYQ